jgi:threonine dehydratase
MLMNATEDPASGQAALSVAFDDPTVQDLLVFSIGDGGAMSGILIAARRVNGEATFLVFLMD